MIPAGVQVFIALDPVDMRMGFDGLSGVVRDRIGYDPRGGALFVFLNKRRHTVKIVFTDGTGICLFHKRLDKGTFPLPVATSDERHAEIDEVQLEALLDGLTFDDTASPPTRGSKRRVAADRPTEVH